MKKIIFFFFLFLTMLSVRAQSYNIGDFHKVKICNADFYDAGGPLGFAGYDYKVTMFHADSNCLQVTFTGFDLGFGGVLNIYKGTGGVASGMLLGSFSGNNMPPALVGQDLTFEYIPPSYYVGNLPGWTASLQCVDCSLATIKSDPASDCPGAIPLCANQTVIVSTNQYTDTGVLNDDVGSCFSGTGNGGSVWYTFQPQTTGNLDFSISPSGSTDYDYVLYDGTNGCGNLNELSCNFSATYGVTGITTNSGNYTSSYSGCSGSNYYSAPADCGVWNQAVGVTVGHTYYLMVNFYGGSNNGFTLHFQNDPGTVSITDNIPPTFATATQPGCNGSSIHVTFSENINCSTMQASGFSIAGHTISIANSGCANNMTTAVTLNITPPLAPGSYTLHGQTMTDMCGNPLNDDITFTIVNAVVTVSVTGNDICQGTASTLTANTTGTGTMNYNWSNGGTGSTTSVTTGGNYCVTVSDLCANSASDCLSISELPAPTFNVSTSCNTAGTIATFTETGCTGTFTWNKWDTVCITTCIGYMLFGNCIGILNTTCDSAWSVIGTSPTLDVNAPYYSQYMASCVGANGCTTQNVFLVNCNPTLSVSVNSASICSGGCTAITATVNGGVAPLTYTWDQPGVSGAGPVNVCPTTTTTYTVTVSDAGGNTASASGTVNVGTSLSPAITGATSICTGSSTTLDAGVGYDTYLWSTNETTQTIDVTTAGPYVVTVSDASGCSGTTSVIITVNSNLTPAITGPTSICTGTTATLDAGSGYATYSWSTNETTQTIDVNTGGTYTVTVSNGSGCSGSTSVTVTANQLNATASGTAESCGLGNGTATASPTGTCGTGFIYAWSSSPSQSTPTANNLSAGTYTVTISCGACSTTASVTISNVAGPVITVTNTTNASCGQSDGLANISVSGGTPAYSYNWNSSPAQTTQNLTHVPTGSYHVTVTDSLGCSSTASVTVAENPGPSAIATSTNEICDRANGTATVITSGGSGTYTYLWSDNQNTPTATALAAGTYTVTVNDGFCTAVASTNVTNVPGPVAGFSSTPVPATIYDPVVFLNNSSGNVISWTWNFGDGSASGTGNQLLHQFTNLGAYSVTLIVTDNNGCSDSTTNIVNVKEIFTFYVPNSITPDENGLNDAFTPKGYNVDPNGFEMYIFDRWGKLFYHTTEWSDNTAAKPWNGTLNNSGSVDKVIVGVYVYRIIVKELDGPKHEYLGGIAVIQ